MIDLYLFCIYQKMSTAYYCSLKQAITPVGSCHVSDATINIKTQQEFQTNATCIPHMSIDRSFIAIALLSWFF